MQGGSAGSRGDLGGVWIRRLCKSDLNQRCYRRSQGATALIVAAGNGHRDCVAELLAADVDKAGGPRSQPESSRVTTDSGVTLHLGPLFAQQLGGLWRFALVSITPWDEVLGL